MPGAVPQTIIDTSLTTSLLVFGIRVLVKELTAVLRDLFQIVEFTIRQWIYIRGVVKGLTTTPAAFAAGMI